MNINAKIQNKILVNWISKYVNRIKHHDPVGFIPRMQGWFNTHKSTNVIYCINKTKDKNHMSISKDEEKTLERIQHPFMTKTLSKLCVRKTYINSIKAIYGKPTANIVLSRFKAESFPLRLGIRKGFPHLHLCSIQG